MVLRTNFRRFLLAVLLGLLFALPGKAADSAVFLPLNPLFYAFRSQEVGEVVFATDEADEHALIGPSPWQGEREGRMVTLLRGSDDPATQAGYRFGDGYLRQVLKDGKVRNLPVPPYAGTVADLAALWPAKEKRNRLGPQPDIWSNSGRLRLWYDNPNKAGCLFVGFALLSLAFVVSRRLCTVIPCAACFLAAVFGLVLSGSRGAFLALIAGLGAILATKARKHFTCARMAVVILALVSLAGVVLSSGFGDRFSRNLFKEGDDQTSRLRIWKEVPAMVADAPFGWGVGRSARPYIDWYQESADCIVRDLMSGHFCLVVEAGWIPGLAYLALWIFLLLEGVRHAVRGRSALPLAILVAYAVANVFNPLLYVWETALIPLGAAALVLANTVRNGFRSWRWTAAFALGMAAAILGCAVVYGKASRDTVSIAKRGNAVLVNGSAPVAWVVDDDYTLHGGYWWTWGNSVRKYFNTHADLPCVAFVRSLEDLPKKPGRLVVVGECASQWLASPVCCEAAETILISPPFSWKAVPEEVLSKTKLRLMIGEVAARHCADYEDAPKWVRKFRGCGLYLPVWLDLACGR